MQIYERATAGKRFLAYYVDYFLIGVFINTLYYIFINEQANSLTDQYISKYSNTGNLGLVDILKNVQHLNAYNYVVTSLIILEAIKIIISLLYFILLPLFWKKQTVGRALAKIKLVRKNNNEVTVSNLIMRQIIGRIVFSISAIFIVGMFIEIICVFRNQPTTIEDGCGRTKMIDRDKVS